MGGPRKEKDADVILEWPLTKKFTKKFVSNVIKRQYFHRKTGL